MKKVILYIKPKNKRIIREVFYISSNSDHHYKPVGCIYCKIWKKKSELGFCNLCAKARIELGPQTTISIMPKRFYVF